MEDLPHNAVASPDKNFDLGSLKPFPIKAGLSSPCFFWGILQSLINKGCFLSFVLLFLTLIATRRVKVKSHEKAC